MGKWLHRLSDINIEEKTAICSGCGEVKIKKKPDGWRCYYSTKYGSANAVSKPKPKLGQCEICTEVKKLFFDHDHQTGNHRGWLCRECNLILGFAKDNIETLKKASQYLIT